MSTLPSIGSRRIASLFSEAPVLAAKMLPTRWQRPTAMTRDIGKDVRSFVLKTFPLARKQHIADSDYLLESGMLDSQGMLEVVTFIEKEFAIGVDDEDLVSENFHSIDRIVAFIRNKSATISKVH
jgi:acyl carrier protein